MANSTMVCPFDPELAIWLGCLGFTDLPDTGAVGERHALSRSASPTAATSSSNQS